MPSRIAPREDGSRCALHFAAARISAREAFIFIDSATAPGRRRRRKVRTRPARSANTSASTHSLDKLDDAVSEKRRGSSENEERAAATKRRIVPGSVERIKRHQHPEKASKMASYLGLPRRAA